MALRDAVQKISLFPHLTLFTHILMHRNADFYSSVSKNKTVERRTGFLFAFFSYRYRYLCEIKIVSTHLCVLFNTKNNGFYLFFLFFSINKILSYHFQSIFLNSIRSITASPRIFFHPVLLFYFIGLCMVFLTWISFFKCK